MPTIDPESGYPVCENPACPGFGHYSHPNCKCFPHMRDGGPVHLAVYQEGGEVEPQEPLSDPQETVDHYVANHGLLNLLTKAGQSNSDKNVENYMNGSERGKKKLKSHMGNLLGNGKLNIDHDKNSVEALSDHLNSLDEDPSPLLNVGGQLDPVHATQIGATSSNAIEYLRSIKPMSQQPNPLDEIAPPTKMEEGKYNRQLSIAQNPLMILRHTKEGTLYPQDLTTLHSLYPKLGKSLTDQAGEALIEAKSRDMHIPYKQKQALSMLLGTPLDSTQTPQAIQAIMASAAPQQASRMPQPSKKGKGNQKATSAELKQLNKVDEMYETANEARIINRNKP